MVAGERTDIPGTPGCRRRARHDRRRPTERGPRPARRHRAHHAPAGRRTRVHVQRVRRCASTATWSPRPRARPATRRSAAATRPGRPDVHPFAGPADLARRRHPARRGEHPAGAGRRRALARGATASPGTARRTRSTSPGRRGRARPRGVRRRRARRAAADRRRERARPPTGSASAGPATSGRPDHPAHHPAARRVRGDQPAARDRRRRPRRPRQARTERPARPSRHSTGSSRSPDYADFARPLAGIGRADATRLPTARGSRPRHRRRRGRHPARPDVRPLHRLRPRSPGSATPPLPSGSSPCANCAARHGGWTSRSAPTTLGHGRAAHARAAPARLGFGCEPARLRVRPPTQPGSIRVTPSGRTRRRRRRTVDHAGRPHDPIRTPCRVVSAVTAILIERRPVADPRRPRPRSAERGLHPVRPAARRAGRRTCPDTLILKEADPHEPRPRRPARPAADGLPHARRRRRRAAAGAARGHRGTGRPRPRRHRAAATTTGSSRPADWVVPYLGDLVGYRPLPGYEETPGTGRTARRPARPAPGRRRTPSPTAAARAPSPCWRNWRPTSPAGRPAPWSSPGCWPPTSRSGSTAAPPTPPPRGGYPGRTVDLRDGDALDLADGPFDTLAHLADVRRVTSARRQGGPAPAGVGLFVWRLKPYAITRGPGVLRRPGPQPLHLHHPRQRHARSSPGPAASPSADAHRRRSTTCPAFIRRRRVRRASRGDYYGPGKSCAIWRDEERQPVPLADIVAADLTDWRYRPRHGQVAVDPVLGRIAFGARSPPTAGCGSATTTRSPPTSAAASTNATSHRPARRYRQQGRPEAAGQRTRATTLRDGRRGLAVGHRQGRRPTAPTRSSRSPTAASTGAARRPPRPRRPPGGARRRRTRPVIRLLDWYSNRPDALGRVRGDPPARASRAAGCDPGRTADHRPRPQRAPDRRARSSSGTAPWCRAGRSTRLRPAPAPSRASC